MKLTPKLTLIFVLFAALLLIVVDLLIYNSGQNALQAAAVAELEATAGEKKAALSAWADDKESDIQILAHDPTIIQFVTSLVQAPSLAIFNTNRNDLIRELKPRILNHDFLVVMLLDPKSGRVLVATDPKEEGKLRNDRPYFLEGRIGTFLTPIYYSPELQTPAMTVSAPIHAEDGHLLGVLAGRININELNAIIQRRSGAHQTDDVFLINPSHEYITQPRFLTDPAILTRGLQSPDANLCLEGKKGTIFSRDYNDVPVIAVYRWLPERQMCLITTIAQSEALASEHSFAATAGWIGFAALLVASLLAVGLSHTLIRPIRTMQLAAQRYSNGDLTVRLFETSKDELGLLAKEFNVMAASLEEKERLLRLHSLELEKEVEVRTEELQQNQMRFQALIENAPDGIALLGLDGTLRQVTPSTLQILGYTLDDARGQDPAALTHPDDLPGLLSLLGDLLQTPGEVARAQYRFLHKDGSWRWLESTISNLMGEPSVNAIVFNYRDITERVQAEEIMRRYELLAENSRDIILFVRVEDGKILDANVAAVSAYGYSREELLDLKIFDLRADDTKGLTSRQIIEANDHGTLFEAVHRRKDGTTFPVEVSSQGTLIGGIRVLVSILRDTTERKQTEIKLADALEFNQRILISSPIGILTYKFSGECISVNSYAAQVIGTTVEELKNQNFHALESWKRSGLYALAEKAMSGESYAAADIHHVTTFGRSIWLRAQFVTMRSHEDTLLLLTIADITQRKQAEDELREKERLLSEAQQIGQVGSVSFDIPNDQLQFSDETYRLLDILPEKFQHNSRDFLALVYPSDRSQVATWISDLRAGWQIKELDFRIFRQNGELRYLHCRGAVEFSSSGAPSRFIGTMQDVTERQLAEIQINQQVKRLTALSEIDRAIIAGPDQSPSLDVIMSVTLSNLQVDAAAILLMEGEPPLLHYAAVEGFRSPPSEEFQIRSGESHSGRVAKEKRLIRVPDLKEQAQDPFFDLFVANENFVSYIGVPLIVKKEVKGVFEVFHRRPFQPYQEWLDFLNTLVGQAAVAIENASLLGNLQTSNLELSEAYDATIEGWSRAMDLRDQETEGHTRRVTEMTMEIARAMGISESKLVHIRRGALLHDIGKLGVPDHVLYKPGPLLPDEWELMQKHPELAYEMLSPIQYLKPALPIPYFHHEKWDGSGYPLGLRGDQIPLEARIFAVVDVWDALLSDRPYRKAWTVERTLEHIRLLAGSHFDPDVVNCFLQIMKDRNLSQL